jgi:hypothetical protein
MGNLGYKILWLIFVNTVKVFLRNPMADFTNSTVRQVLWLDQTSNDRFSISSPALRDLWFGIFVFFFPPLDLLLEDWVNVE